MSAAPVGPNGRLSSSYNFLKILNYKNLMFLKLDIRPYLARTAQRCVLPVSFPVDLLLWQ